MYTKKFKIRAQYTCLKVTIESLFEKIEQFKSAKGVVLHAILLAVFDAVV